MRSSAQIRNTHTRRQIQIRRGLNGRKMEKNFLQPSNRQTAIVLSEFYSDQLGVGQIWETDRTVLPMEAWKEYDMPTPDWGKERSSHKPPPTNAINNVEKEGKCTFKALARWVTQQLIAGNGVIDSGATGHFLQQGIGIPTGQPSGKVVGMPNGQQERATKASVATHSRS